jgi:hypothetical protein
MTIDDRASPAHAAVSGSKTVDVRHGVDAFTVGAGSAWALHWSGTGDQLTRVQPGRFQMRKDAVDLDGDDHLDLAATSTALWLVAASRVVCLDALDLGRPPRTIPIDDDGLDAIVAGPQVVWAANSKAGRIWRLDPVHGVAIGEALEVAGGVSLIASDDVALWVAAAAHDVVTRVNAGTRRVAGTPVPLGEAGVDRRIAIAEGVIATASEDGEVCVLDAMSGAVRVAPTRFTAPGCWDFDVAVAGDAAWALDGDGGTITRIPFRGGAGVTTARFTAPGAFPIDSASSLTVGGRTAWVTNSAHPTIYSFDVGTP